jgi:hypothetical protein
MDVVIEAIGQGLLITLMTVFLQVIYIIIELLSCILTVFVKGLFGHTVDYRKLLRSLGKFFLMRLVIIGIVCIVLSAIKHLELSTNN